MKKKVVVAFSGGLDFTSFTVMYLAKRKRIRGCTPLALTQVVSARNN